MALRISHGTVLPFQVSANGALRPGGMFGSAEASARREPKPPQGNCPSVVAGYESAQRVGRRPVVTRPAPGLAAGRVQGVPISTVWKTNVPAVKRSREPFQVRRPFGFRRRQRPPVPGYVAPTAERAKVLRRVRAPRDHGHDVVTFQHPGLPAARTAPAVPLEDSFTQPLPCRPRRPAHTIMDRKVRFGRRDRRTCSPAASTKATARSSRRRCPDESRARRRLADESRSTPVAASETERTCTASGSTARLPSRASCRRAPMSCVDWLQTGRRGSTRSLVESRSRAAGTNRREARTDATRAGRSRPRQREATSPGALHPRSGYRRRPGLDSCPVAHRPGARDRRGTECRPRRRTPPAGHWGKEPCSRSKSAMHRGPDLPRAFPPGAGTGGTRPASNRAPPATSLFQAGEGGLSRQASNAGCRQG